jgi:hypothetical protein
MQFSWPVFFGSLFTGVLGVTISIVSTIAYNRWAELRRLQIDCFRQLCRYSASDNEYFRAFNEVPALFSNRPIIIEKHLKVIESGDLIGNEMADFFLTLAKEMGMSGGTRDQMLRRFSVSSPAKG